MLPMQTDRIRHLKELFDQAGKGLASYDLGEQGRLNKVAQSTGVRMAELQLSLIAQGTRLMKLSADQVQNCLNITRHVKFFGDELYPDNHDFVAQGKLTASFTRLYSEMFLEDNRDTQHRIALHMGHLESCDAVDSGEGEKAISHMNAYLHEVERFNSINASVELFKERVTSGVGLSYEMERSGQAGKSPRAVMAALQSNSARNAGNAIGYHIEYGLTHLAKMQFIRDRVVAVLPHLADELQQESFETFLKTGAILGRIDRLVELQGRNDDLFEPKVA